MSKIRYIETKPIQQILNFEGKSEYYEFFNKRIEEIVNYAWANGINYKDYFAYEKIVLNKNGTPRKMINPVKWFMSKKARKNQTKNFAIYCAKRKEKTFQRNKDRKLFEIDAEIDRLRLEKKEIMYGREK